ncbi:sex comb on midleg-like protein 1 isoform X2 [Saccopteryx leptura]|uniref:sex comb on midleg-like protein 1 isoform X2 n=1 Tax=Saccopteryx leptura TaxID=249018 RepID=UPI00339CCC2D
MSSCSSEDDVQSVHSDTPYDKLHKGIGDVVRRCQVIQDTVQNLDTKFTGLNRKVSKLYRYHTKLVWQNRKPLVSAYKHYRSQLSRKTKLQKRKEEDPPLPLSLSGNENYSPTSPVRRPTPYSQENAAGAYYQSPDSQLWDHESLEEQETRLSQSPTFSPFCTVPYPSCLPRYTCSGPDADPEQGTSSASSVPCCASPVAHSTTSGLSAVQASTLAPAAMLNQGPSSPAHNPEERAHPPLLESESLGHAASALDSAADCGASSAAETHSDIPGKVIPDDPSTWSVEEVILFLKQRDPQTITPVEDVFRQRDIDGKAMLMLQTDIMLNHMGLKLGTVVKLRHYIEKLKQEKCIDL